MTDHNIPRAEKRTVRRSIAAAGSFVLTTHINPDGDGLGCEYALYHHLRSRGASVRIINPGPVPENYRFLDGGAPFETYDPAIHTEEVLAVDAILVVDLNDARRLSSMEAAVRGSRARKIVIDHHLRPQPFADMYLLDEGACACGEMIFDLLDEPGGASLSRDMAEGLYIAIMTDTGSFRFERTTPRVHRITASLLEAGADPSAIHRMIFDEYPLSRTLLLGRVLASITLLQGGWATISRITRSDFSETGSCEEEAENMVNYGLAVRGVVATALCVDMPDCVKISFRSTGSIDVSAVARSFGGGGHRNAAGARMYGVTLDRAREAVAVALVGLRAGPAADQESKPNTQ